MADAGGFKHLSFGKPPSRQLPKVGFPGDMNDGNFPGGLIGILKAGLIYCNPHIIG